MAFEEFFNIDLVETIAVPIVRIIIGIITFAIFIFLARHTKMLISRYFDRKSNTPQLSAFLSETYFYTVILVGIIIALIIFGLKIEEVFAAFALLGIAFGLAARSTIENFISGLVIFWDKPFYLGDYIEVEDNYGRVAEITLRSTRIRTNKNEYIIIPNSEITNSKLINHSKKGHIRIEIPVTITYDQNIDEVKKTLLSVVKNDAKINDTPKPDATVEELADYGVHMKLRFWITEISHEKRIIREYTEKVKKALDKAGIEIPYPHMVIKMEDDNKKK